MTRTKKIAIDLFGHPIQKQKTRLESKLSKIDRDTFDERLERFKFLESLSPKNFGMAGSMESIFIFHKARWSYLNGAFISTILLSQAFIERRLNDFMMSNGLENEAKRGAASIINFCRKHNLLDEFLLVKFDHLRNVRNPLTHLKPHDHPFSLDQRMFRDRMRPHEILNEEAKKAIGLMYTILFTRL